MESECTSLNKALCDLDAIAPDAPLLALGQTVLWDEPMKAGVALAAAERRPFIAGIHDTDYFAKLPSGPREPGKFRAMPHNDGSTKGLWSAAAEFSTLFGGETVVKKTDFQSAGAKIEQVAKSRPEVVDRATEAFGWRGVVSLDDDPPIAAELPLRAVFPELQKTLNWAISESLDALAPDGRLVGEAKTDELWAAICEAYERMENGSLADFYRALTKDAYTFAAGREVVLETTQTTELLQFNATTASLPRFELVNLFVDPTTRWKAAKAYNDALAGSEIYGLDRFGTGAIPFDLVIPGEGRGTIRIGNRGVIIMTKRPKFISLKAPLRSIQELGELVERKFGVHCALIGKAVSLIGMLSREFVFVFHEGASSYVSRSKEFHDRLAQAGLGMPFLPILRIRYAAWDALSEARTWFNLPKPFHLAFGAEEVCAPSFASRWRTVADEQQDLLVTLRNLRRPIDLIRFLEKKVGGTWNEVAIEYAELQRQLESHMAAMDDAKQRRHKLYSEVREAKLTRVAAERAKGDHFRSKVFEKSPSQADLDERERLSRAVDDAIIHLAHLRNEIRQILREQDDIASRPEILHIHDRRRALEKEAELKRIRLIRNAVISSRGLVRAGQRPSAWWFPLVSPDGAWFRETVRRAEAYLEPLATAAPAPEPIAR